MSKAVVHKVLANHWAIQKKLIPCNFTGTHDLLRPTANKIGNPKKNPYKYAQYDDSANGFLEVERKLKTTFC